MAVINKIMKTFNVPDGQGNIKRYEIIDDAGRKCVAVDWYEHSTNGFDAGSYVVKDGIVYLFKSNHAAGSAWNASEVTATNIGEEVKALRDNVVLVQDTEPENNYNHIWIDPSPEDVSIPTYPELQAVEETVLGKLNRPATNGTAGQILRTNGDGTTSWITEGTPTDEQVAESVEDWLEDHPDATTTVEDGSITRAKLHSNLADEIDQKAPAIKAVASDYVHKNVDSVEIQGNAVAFGNARYANRKNYIINSNPSSGGTTVTAVKYRNIVKIDGEPSSATDGVFCIEEVDMPAGSYTFKVEPYVGESTMASGKNFHLDIWYDGNETTTHDARITLYGVKDEAVLSTFTATSHIWKIRVWFGYAAGNAYSDYRIFYSLFPSDVTIVDTGETCGSGETLDIDLVSNMPVIDTMMHSSNAEKVLDTKTYVDQHTPNIDFVYFRPEDYGAVGDGNTDDSEALQACINAAQSASYSVSAAIRGEGCYKISTSIVFSCRELDVHLNKIIYTGTDVAVIISAMHSHFVFESIRAYSGGNNAVGIRCYQSASQTFYSNKVECAYIRSAGNCVEFREYEGNTSHTIMYNTFYFQYQRSENGHIFDVGIPICNENACYGRYVIATNGYLLHFNRELGGDGNFRLYNYCLENELKNGTNGNAWFYYCRAGEMENQRTIQNPNKGFIFSWEDCVPEGEYKYGTGGVAITSIDTTNAYSWNDVLSEIKQRFEDDPDVDVESVWAALLPGSTGTGLRHAEIYPVDLVASNNMRSSGGSKCLATGKAVVYYNNVAFKPDDEVYCKVIGDMTIQLSSSNNWEYITPTVFDIDTQSATIRLDASYCCIAIDEFDVIQHKGKTAIVIDKLGNVIFDGSNRGPGTYHFKCDFMPYQYGDVCVTLEDSTVKRCPTGKLAGLYSGYNEQWRVIESDAGEKAPAIYDNASGYVHHNIDKFVAVGNPYAWGNVRYANAQNYITELTLDVVTYGVTIKPHKNIMVLNGTCTGNNDLTALINTNANIPAGNYKYKLEIHPGDSVLSGTKNFYMDFWYEGNETTTYDVRLSFGVGTADAYKIVTLANRVWKYRAWVCVKNGNVYDDYRIFYSLLPSSAVITDTQETIANGEMVTCELNNTMHTVDTLMHSSMAFGIVDTKTYVDNHTPDMVCFRPEDYGAKGDGVTDDSAALQACITAAQASDFGVNSHAIRGYGTYKITTGIVFNCRELDVYINKIIYTGNDAAVTISASYSNFVFNTIHAEGGGSNNIGIKCYKSSDSGWGNYFFRNTVTCNFMYTNGNCVEFVLAEGAVSTFYYSKFYFALQRSTNGSIIKSQNGLGEVDFYGKVVLAPNGWFFDSPDKNQMSARFFNFSFEKDLKNITNSSCQFYYCRYTEMEDQMTPENRENTGRIFAWDNMVPQGEWHGGETGGVCLMSIDASSALTWEQALNQVKNNYDSGTISNAEECWGVIASGNPGSRYAVISSIGRFCNAHFPGGMKISPSGKAVVYYRNVAFVPKNSIYHKVDDDMTIQFFNGTDYEYLTPTVFDIDASSVTITLDVSYCCIGIDKFDVIQHTGKTAIVIDKLGNTIFDGTNLGAGVFHFKCDMVPFKYGELYITKTNSDIRYCPKTMVGKIYSGSNEKWTVSKEELIEPPAQS